MNIVDKDIRVFPNGSPGMDFYLLFQLPFALGNWNFARESWWVVPSDYIYLKNIKFSGVP